MSHDVVSAVLQGQKAAKDGDVQWVAALRLSSSDNVETELGSHHIASTLCKKDIKTAQHDDPVIKSVIQLRGRMDSK